MAIKDRVFDYGNGLLVVFSSKELATLREIQSRDDRPERKEYPIRFNALTETRARMLEEILRDERKSVPEG